MELQTRIYQKQNTKSLWTLIKESLNDIYTSRFLAKQLTIRDIKAQYRQSYFGILWAFIGPLTTALVWIFLNNSGTIKLSDTGIPYPVYVFSGTLLWSIMIEAINSPMLSTNSARSIISKINFPKEALIISGIYKLLFNSSIKIALLVIFLLIYQIPISWTILLFPFTLLAIIIFGTTLGLFITPLGLLYTDVSKAISFTFRFIMYLTPVIYVVPKTGIMKTLMELNPLTPLLLTARDVLVGQPPQYLTYYCVILSLSFLLLLVALAIYRVSIPILTERIG
ncbi:ABC transporter permease [Urechidicola croceus]|uniref:ABC transporter permease n=1 Tax=Urechidicola croceus TaxID=1850246 RepID=UPI0009F48E50|nr:ABC transporter permease [Urechidicola croceus]